MTHKDRSNVDAVQAAYIHVPFCLSKCAYCDFASQAGKADRIPDWFHCVQQEIRTVSRWADCQTQPKERLSSVFIGGGTPSLVDPACIADLIDTLRTCFGLTEDAEVTMEANPGTLTAEAAVTLAQAGVNRISLGLQTANPALLQRLGRCHDAKDFVNSVRFISQAGIERISADIMLGLPGQTLADVDQTLDLVLSLPIGHLSYYSLIIEEGTPFFERYHDQPQLLPDEMLEREMYHHTMDRLAGQGIQPYEISNAAAAGQVCRHNLVYWQAKPYYGFGPAAHSYLGGFRRGNTSDLETYLQCWSIESEPVQIDESTVFRATEEADFIDESERRKETMLLGLRLLEGVRYDEFLRRHGVDMTQLFAHELQRLEMRGLVVVDHDGVRLSRIGLDLANQVFIDFI